MWKSLQATIPKDNDLPARAHKIACLTSILDGTQYDNLEHAFHTERDGSGEYIPLRERRPSVRYALCSAVVDDSVALLFSDEHFPTVTSEAEGAADTLSAITKDCNINGVMIDAATRGSVGSVAILLRVLENRLFFDVMPTAYLTPTWKATAPDTLEKVTERYKVTGAALAELGYSIADDDLGAKHWFQRDWDDAAETWYVPQPVDPGEKRPPKLTVDTQRSVQHGLGFVPFVWIKNLPGGDDVDGKCTFAKAIDTNVELDYLLSQGGRGLKYSMDPTLLIKEPATGQGNKLIKGGGNAIVVGADGDAKMLEMSGDGTNALLEYVRLARQIALESIHGNKADADKIAAAQSGRAMELMNQALVSLAARLRISYGESGLLRLYRMIAKVSNKTQLVDSEGVKVPKISTAKPLALKWPPWYAPTWADKTNEASALTALTSGGLLSKETATTSLADQYDVEDVTAELARIKSDADAEDARNAANAQAAAAAKKPVIDNDGD